MKTMDTTETVADELNRGCYAENVLKYFFDKPDSYEQALTDSEDDLSDDESDMIRLYNIPNLQLSEDDEDQDEEECIELASDELDRKISEAISVVTFEGDEDREMQKIRNFDCKCYTRRKENPHGRQSCSQKLSPDIMYNIRMDSLAAEKEWQDMRIIGHLEANRRTVLTSEMITSKKKAPTKRKCARTTYFIGGIEICKNTFVFLMGIGRDTLADIVKHYEENGARPRLRKKHSLPRPPVRFIKSEDINRVVDFIKNYAEDNAILLPGQQPGHKYCHVKLLPTHVSKASVWRLYVKSAKELGERAVCKTSFKALWNRLLPHIKSSRPRTDLCWQCQSNTEQLIQSANLPDDRKSEAVKKQQDHLSLVQKERDQYNDLNAACRKICSGSNLSFGPSLPASKKIRMHYSFDFAQQLHFPSNPLQPGPTYFLTPRKCGLFGISCEGLQKQVNYLIDEGMSSAKGSNEVISYMHHFFGNFGVGETEVDLHCDDCSGQNKNNFMLWYLAWRAGHKLHDKIDLHFLIAGHTKFSPDCGFGLIKQAYKKTTVNTLADIAEVVEKSSPVSHLNIPQLVGTAEGKVLVQTFDWQHHLSRHFRRLPQIKSYHHFSFDAKRPGVVLAKTDCDAQPVEFQLLRDGEDLPPIDGLLVLSPPGLNIERQTYLYEKIRPFCAKEARHITCPAPRVTAQKRKRM
ncbi:uncharacterized protein [Misgurnus anguillicaudatus]|uniref:uncharacterized protein n=1 Tax=Misgurnus anguillicaudatus TaxID=75329 RepID=UPI003CCF85D3